MILSTLRCKLFTNRLYVRDMKPLNEFVYLSSEIHQQTTDSWIQEPGTWSELTVLIWYWMEAQIWEDFSYLFSDKARSV